MVEGDYSRGPWRHSCTAMYISLVILYRMYTGVRDNDLWAYGSWLGDKWEMYIPSELAYGDSGRVPGCLVFTMEIIKINGSSKPKVKKDD